MVSAFINNTYHALVHYEGRDLGVAPVAVGGIGYRAVDARPSDAINLALRMGAPVYVAKKVRAPRSHNNVRVQGIKLEPKINAMLPHLALRRGRCHVCANGSPCT